MPLPSRGIVTLTLACPNACVFCAQDGLAPRPELSMAEVRSALRALRPAHVGVTFAGGEPALVPALDDFIAAARAEGFSSVGIQTNGAGLGESARLEQLARAGLTDVHLSIHGADAALHDYHTGTAGSLERVLRCLAAARASGLEVVVSTLLTRSNFRSLEPLAALLVGRGASAWCISIPSVAGRAETSFDRVIPRLGLALPFALRALSGARARGLATFVLGAPLCLLGPRGADAIGNERRAYAAACERCPAQDVCPGVDAVYLERFDGDELAPRSTLARPIASEAARRFADAFIGPGERAPVRGVGAEPSPAKARRALPMLGRGQPAVAEVGRGEKRSGEALRAIFPSLFEPGDKARDDEDDGEAGA